MMSIKIVANDIRLIIVHDHSLLEILK